MPSLTISKLVSQMDIGDSMGLVERDILRMGILTGGRSPLMWVVSARCVALIAQHNASGLNPPG